VKVFYNSGSATSATKVSSIVEVVKVIVVEGLIVAEAVRADPSSAL